MTTDFLQPLVLALAKASARTTQETAWLTAQTYCWLPAKAGRFSCALTEEVRGSTHCLGGALCSEKYCIAGFLDTWLSFGLTWRSRGLAIRLFFFLQVLGFAMPGAVRSEQRRKPGTAESRRLTAWPRFTK